VLIPADGDICAYRRGLVVLHPGSQVEEAGQQQVDERHQDGEGQQTGLVQQRVGDGVATAQKGLEVLLGGKQLG